MTVFKPTTVQRQALKLVKGGAKHILLFGGSRSGKTTVLVMVIIYRAIRFASSRHLICRYRAKDARSSVLRETLLPALTNTVGTNRYNYLAHESMITLFNGSEIWIGGLGDREQADKILGHEYNTIYFNEISQLSYISVTTAYSRLAMRVPGCRNLFLYDCNPGSPLHWAYRIFIRKQQFLNGEPLVKPELYASMILNPADNAEHLPDDYISDVLGAMPEKQKARFRDGAWVKAEGVIYELFDESMILKAADMPKDYDRICAGQDFGLNITNVKIGWVHEVVYVIADYGAFNMTTKSFNEELTARHWFDLGPDSFSFPVYCDPAGGERIQEITGGVKANNSVESGIDFINAKIERGQFFVADGCTGVLSEIWDYCRDEAGEIIKVNDHFMDALRYAVFSDVQQGVIAQ
ncbi:phage terminase large subunit [Leadbettera azotonutricia]|uniref:Phage terminase, large subunit, PBSX family n=1 Tax=Leadbettera azotonutricia (strain ATCC BAA-888 / DSM 13862 / ZAS-9) TaxID=545695 RepID=F5YBA1_LEAAZ|nr:phage terminase large subunit [Leadbettera azotonutricia]AEF80248.1 phage terminase, large subunit, PBSX family [Leadbettera azotonutricia ZAS-9]